MIYNDVIELERIFKLKMKESKKPEPDCPICNRQDCICDEETMQALDERDREEDERN